MTGRREAAPGPDSRGYPDVDETLGVFLVVIIFDHRYRSRMHMALALMRALVLGVAAAARPRVDVGNATVIGTVNGSVDVFAGIEFATIPRRFAAAVRSPVSGVVDAGAYGPPCLQYGLDDTIIGSEFGCLTLNVFRPRARTGSARPVMVFVHGGGLTSGAASTYDFKDLASGGVVVVSIQYRLSWAGFLSAPGVLEPRNFGILDQIAALEWVRDYVPFFGGDASRTTVFGQSAGATSVLLLAASPLSKGLFRRAIAQSPWWAANQIGGLDAAEARDYVWRECWCDVVDCAAGGVRQQLEGADAANLTRACGSAVAVVSDGSAVVASPIADLCGGGDPFFAALEDPDFELLVGSNENEYRYWMMGLGNLSATLSEIEGNAEYYARANLLPLDFGLRVNVTEGWTLACAANASNDFLDRVGAAVGRPKPWDAVAFMTDFWFTVPTALAAAAPSTRTARYLNAHPIDAPTVVPLETMHCAELPYVLGFEGFEWRYDNADENAVRAYFQNPTDDMRSTKTFMQDLWLSFARRGLAGAGWPDPTEPDATPYARLVGQSARTDDAPVSTRESFDLARALYCDTRDLAAAYLRDCRARAPGPVAA